ncbi:MAG: hypothetical protein HY644_01230 [Acidobacteria bacterium]|nr:hypothetical protein [Acidobacteriota bacterium]
MSLLPRFLAFSERRLLLAILLAAATLRIIGANSEFWFDEIVTVQYSVRLPALEIVSDYTSTNNHVLNSLLAHAAAVTWGERPWVIRLPAVAFGIAAVWAFYFLARAIWPGGVVLAGTFLFALSYPHIFYTQSARGYSAFMFFALLANGLLFRFFGAEGGGRKRFYGACYALALGLGMYALLLMAFVVLGHGCVAVITRCWHALAWLAAGLLMALLLYAPLALGLVNDLVSHPAWTGYSLWSRTFWEELRPIWMLLLIGVPPAVALLLRMVSTKPRVTALLVLPLVFNVALPAAVQTQGIHPRFFIYALSLVYLFLIEGLDWIGQHLISASRIIVLGLSLTSLAALPRYYSLPKQGFQQALAYINARRGAEDGVVGLALAGKALRYYDGNVLLVEDLAQLQQYLGRTRHRTWVLFTFEKALRQSKPDLYAWVKSATIPQAIFPGTIGDGAVRIRLWVPDKSVNFELQSN